MKVTCIGFNPMYTHHRRLIIGEVYDGYVNSNMTDTYGIYKDRLYIGHYDTKWFISLQEWRDKQIDDILED